MVRSLENVIKEYFNRAGQLMEGYYADLYTDIEHIKNIRFNTALYFIVQPNGTHVCGEDEYNDIRDACADCWGNYCVFRVYHYSEGYNIDNWDALLSKGFDTQDERIINNYKEFKIGKQMKSNKRYVTFSCLNHKNEKSRFAIECETSMEALDVAMDISSYACFKNVSFNNCGRFVKDTIILNCKDYKRHFSDTDSFVD